MRHSIKRLRFDVFAALAAAGLVSAPGAAVEPQWVQRYDGPDHMSDVGQSIAAGPEGSVYVSGYSYEWQGEVAIASWVLQRIDGGGTPLWVRRETPGASGGTPDKLLVDGAGNLVVLGTVQPYVAVEVRKFSPAGDLLWTRELVPPEGQFARGEALAAGPGDTIHVAWFEYNLANVAAVAKLSPGGDVEWVRRYEGPDNPDDGPSARAAALAVDPTGALYAAGSVSAPMLGTEMALWKYDAAGAFQWLRTAGSPTGTYTYDGAIGVALDGEAIVVGGTFGGNSGLGTDLAVARYDADGERDYLTIWRSAGSGGDLANAFALAPNGNLYLAGSSERGPNNYAALVAAFDAAGAPLWDESFDGPGDSYSHFRAVHADGASRACVAGRDPGAAGVDTYLVASVESAGGVAWVHRYSPVAGQPSDAADLTISTDDAVVVTGDSWAAAPGGGFSEDLVTVRFPAAPLFLGDFDAGDSSAWGGGE